MNRPQDFPLDYEPGPGQGCAPWCEYDDPHDGPCLASFLIFEPPAASGTSRQDGAT